MIFWQTVLTITNLICGKPDKETDLLPKEPPPSLAKETWKAIRGKCETDEDEESEEIKKAYDLYYRTGGR